MKTSFLFPNHYRWIGVSLVIPVLILMLFDFFPHHALSFLEADIPMLALFSGDGQCFVWEKTQFNSTFSPILLTIGLLFIAFSKEKIEDEYILKIRESSLVWAVIAYYILFIGATFLLYGFAYLNFLHFSFYMVLVIYIFRFHYLLYRLKKSLKNEE